jgi:hypothetical protein
MSLCVVCLNLSLGTHCRCFLHLRNWNVMGEYTVMLCHGRVLLHWRVYTKASFCVTWWLVVVVAVVVVVMAVLPTWLLSRSWFYNDESRTSHLVLDLHSVWSQLDRLIHFMVKEHGKNSCVQKQNMWNSIGILPFIRKTSTYSWLSIFSRRTWHIEIFWAHSWLQVAKKKRQYLRICLSVYNYPRTAELIFVKFLYWGISPEFFQTFQIWIKADNSGHYVTTYMLFCSYSLYTYLSERKIELEL